MTIVAAEDIVPYHSRSDSKCAAVSEYWRKDWAGRLADINAAADLYPWGKKKDIAFFRGKLTGRDWPTDLSGQIPLSVDEPRSNPRWAILSKKDGYKTPKKGVEYDVGGVPGPDSEYNATTVEEMGITPGATITSDPPVERPSWMEQGEVTMPEHCQFKYLLNPAGRGPQGIRLKELMVCGSLTYMHDWPHREAYYHLIEPWKHVVLWASTSDGQGGSNLDATLDWAALHPEAAEQIAKNGRKLINERVNHTFYNEWFREFILEFKRLSRFDPADPALMEGCTPLAEDAPNEEAAPSAEDAPNEEAAPSAEDAPKEEAAADEAAATEGDAAPTEEVAPASEVAPTEEAAATEEGTPSTAAEEAPAAPEEEAAAKRAIAGLASLGRATAPQ